MDREVSTQYDALAKGAGVCSLAEWETVRVAGRDRATLLHNLCTSDVKGLAVGDGCETFFCDVKGKIVAHAFILASEEAIFLITEPGTAARLVPHLDRYIIREDVTLADETKSRRWLSISGAAAPQCVDEACGGVAASLRGAWGHGSARCGDVSVRVVKCDLLWPGGFLLGVDNTHVEAVIDELRLGGATLCGAEAWQAVRVESGWPLYGVDFDETSLPQEVGRDAAAINFRKGCYLGQETVARIDALGHVNKRLVTVRADAIEFEPGDELTSGDQSVGGVTSPCWSPTLGASLALAMIRRGFNGEGVPLACRGNPAVVISTPAIVR